MPGTLVVETLAFETSSDAMRGEMTVAITLTATSGGTDVLAVHDHLPPGLSPADNEEGWRMALGKLAALVEVEATERLFSYGTLQLEAVQMATFGRVLDGTSDALSGYAVIPLEIDDPAVVALSGKAQHTMARFSGRLTDVVAGVVFAVMPQEIQNADEYEVAAVKRVAVVLESGTRAWVYVDAT